MTRKPGPLALVLWWLAGCASAPLPSAPQGDPIEAPSVARARLALARQGERLQALERACAVPGAEENRLCPARVALDRGLLAQAGAALDAGAADGWSEAAREALAAEVRALAWGAQAHHHSLDRYARILAARDERPLTEAEREHLLKLAALLEVVDALEPFLEAPFASPEGRSLALEARLAAAEARVEAGRDPEAARATAEDVRAAAQAPHLPRAEWLQALSWLVEGRALLAAGRPAEAAEALGTAITTRWHPTFHMALAEALEAQGDWQSAAVQWAWAEAGLTPTPDPGKEATWRLEALGERADLAAARAHPGVAAARARLAEQRAEARRRVAEATPPATQALRVVADTSVGALAGGRPALVSFWATHCGACVQELPTLAALRARGEVAVLAVNLDEDPEAARSFLEAQGLGLPFVWGGARGLVAAIGQNSLPLLVLLDPQGRECHRRTGRLSPEALEALAADLAAGRCGPPEGASADASAP